MIDLLLIFSLYFVQGCVQGVVFGTAPLLLGRNPSATDVHQSKLSLAGYPFSFKFIIAPLIDGIYSKRLGRRESWLLPLQCLTSALLAYLATRCGPMLEKSPPDMEELTTALFILVAATAAGDIATDAWAAGRLSDSRASVCQAVGLTLGIQVSTSMFFLLLGKGLMDLGTLLIGMSTAGFLILGTFGLRIPWAIPEETDASENEGVAAVMRRIYDLVRGSPNVRWWVLFLVLVPVIGGHSSVLGIRYQAAGFSPELFAEYDLYLLPISLLVTWLGGKLSQMQQVLSVLVVVIGAKGVLDIAMLVHYKHCLAVGAAAVNEATLRVSYIVLSQLVGALDTIIFVIKVAFFNRIAARHEMIAGSVITFLASVSNLGGTLPATWGPVMAYHTGIEVTTLFCLAMGFAVLLGFWSRLRTMEDFADPGW